MIAIYRRTLPVQTAGTDYTDGGANWDKVSGVWLCEAGTPIAAVGDPFPTDANFWVESREMVTIAPGVVRVSLTGIGVRDGVQRVYNDLDTASNSSTYADVTIGAGSPYFSGIAAGPWAQVEMNLPVLEVEHTIVGATALTHASYVGKIVAAPQGGGAFPTAPANPWTTIAAANAVLHGPADNSGTGSWWVSGYRAFAATPTATRHLVKASYTYHWTITPGA